MHKQNVYRREKYLGNSLKHKPPLISNIDDTITDHDDTDLYDRFIEATAGKFKLCKGKYIDLYVVDNEDRVHACFDIDDEVDLPLLITRMKRYKINVPDFPTVVGISGVIERLLMKGVTIRRYR